jgi:Flp pilus assembly pilin Flp
MVVKKGGERTMELLKRLVVEEEGQGLVEYTLIVLLVALVFWVAVKGTNADQALSNTWTNIVNCLNGGLNCTGS